MSTEENKQLILQFYQAFDEHKMDKALAFLAPEFIAHIVGIDRTLDKEEFKCLGMEFCSAFLNSKHIFDEIIVAESKVITFGKFTATHLGEFQGIPPTKQKIEISVMHIDRLENGKIIEHWGQGDLRGLMTQLGILFVPSPKLIVNMIKSRLFKL